MNINDCRPEVQKFAVLMEQVLRQNDWKGGWKDMHDLDVLDRIHEELRELDLAMKRWPAIHKHLAVREAVDLVAIVHVANFCMFLADIYGELDQTEGN